MLQIGKYNRLTIVRFVDFGAYLDGGDDIEILLPAKYVDDNAVIGDEIEVFIYTDSEDRLIATTEKPLAIVGEFAYMKVSDVNDIGAFLEWGIPGKDLLVPFREQRALMKKGGIYLVYVFLDNASKRVVASAKIERYLGNSYPNIKQGQNVEALVYAKTELGYKCIVNNLFQGMLYANELFRPVELSTKIDAYVKRVRNDGKIDLTLSGATGERINTLAEEIYLKLIQSNGKLKVSDKSSPELIKQMFHCSKKDYKKAIGLLYKMQRIRINEDSIEALKQK